jgi:WD40 repeat protein
MVSPSVVQTGNQDSFSFDAGAFGEGMDSGIADGSQPAFGDLDTKGIDTSTTYPEYMGKVHNSLMDKIESKGYAKVLVATTNVAELARTLSGYKYNGLIGAGAEASDDIVVPLLEVPLQSIPDIAALPDVMSIFEYAPPVKHYYEEYEGLGWDGAQPLNLNSTVHHKADKAWEYNFTGNDVKIAVLDDGIDFSHPDLMGTQARVERIHYVAGHVVVASAVGGERLAFIKMPHEDTEIEVPNPAVPIVPNSYSIYKNSVEIFEPGNYTFNAYNGTISLSADLLPGDEITADFAYYSPYYSWPMAFDPFSMSKYLSTGNALESWYVPTNTTDENVTHTIRMDGTNDFWDDGTELVATDDSNDIISEIPFVLDEGNDYDLVHMYVTQDKKYWYIGLNSYANHTTMRFGIYINTTIGGAETDPLGNYVNATAEHRPEFAIYQTHRGSQPYPNWADNDTMENATIFKWDEVSGTWDSGPDLIDPTVGGSESYSEWKFEKLLGFIEYAIPKNYLNDDGNISLIAFTTGINPSQPQDTVYTDPAVNLATPDLTSTNVITLSSFVYVGNGYWTHTYTRPDDTILGVPNTNRTWPTKYVLTGTSKSGEYYFGDLPDKNLPQTRVLVVDEAVAGTYDTVYVDMDNDKDFNDEKPNKKYGKYDSEMFWHDVNWTGPGTVYDEMVYSDFFDAAFGVTSLDYSPNSSYLASASNDHTVIIWYVAGASDTAYRYLTAHMGRVTDVEFSPDGLLIASTYDDASGHDDFNAVIWDFATGNIMNTFTDHTDAVTSVAWSPSGTEVVTSSADGTVRFWNVTTSQLVKTFDLGEPVTVVDWSVQNKIAVGINKEIRIWNSTDAPTVGPFIIPLPEKVASIAFNQNGSWLAVGEYDDLLLVIDIATGYFDSADGLAGHSGNVPLVSVAWEPSGMHLISTAILNETVTSTAVRWEINTLSDFYVHSSKPKGAHAGDVDGCAVSPAGLLATGSKDRMVKIWDPTNMPTLMHLKILVGHTQGSKDYTRYDTGDSLPDKSGGMVYYISTEDIPIPYSDTYSKRLVGVESNLIPKNGQLVTFMGAMDKNQGHGTLVASAITGTGKSLYHDEQTGTDTTVPNVVGIAPNAKIIAVGNVYTTNIFDAWYFAVEGLDGELNTGDEADIASNSYGFSSQYADGWHFYDRFADWISLIYAKGRTTFIFSAGNDGYGYGTVTAPGTSTGVITVGASTDFGYRPQSGLEKGPSPTYGDLATWSSRGPSAMGKPDPDIVANGRMSFGSTALNQVLYAPEFNGSQASSLWAGTSLSAPTAAGILSLVYEAYYKAEHAMINETLSGFVSVGSTNVTQISHAPILSGSFALYKNGIPVPQTNYSLELADGTITILETFTIDDVYTITYRFYNDYPDVMTSRSILMNSADDINFDVLSQGAGFTNAERAVNLANNRSGVMVSPNMWNPGDYHGVEYEAFASFMRPGTYENKAFSVENANLTTDAHLNMTDAVYHKMTEVNYTVVTRLDGNGEPAANWSFIFMSNIADQNLPGPGVYDLSNLSQGFRRKLVDLDENVWLNTELLKISAVVNQSFLDPELDGNLEHNYWLDIYDWTLVCPSLPCADYDPDLVLTSSEDLNRMNMDNPTSNVLEVRVHNPARRIHDGLAIALRPILKGEDGFEFRVKLEFYSKADWNWLEVDSQLVVGGASTPDGKKSFNANLSVPAGTPIGSYQGGIYVYGNQTNMNETFLGRDEYPDEYIKLQYPNVVSAQVWRNTTLLVEGTDYWLHGNIGLVKLAQNVTSATTISVNYWYQNVTTIPVLVNIPSESVDFSFGANAPGQDEFFMNTVIGGFGNGGQSGDWRFYFVDLPDQGLFAGEGMKFFLNISWETNITDIDAFSFGKGGSNPAGVQYPSNRYGPILFMEKKGGSEETGAFYTTTSKNREIVLPPLTGGLNVIAIHNVKMSGNLHEEAFTGEVGLAQVNPSELKIVSNKLADSRTVRISASKKIYGLNGVAAGPSAPERIVDIPIKQDDVGTISTNEDFLKALADGDYTKTLTVQKSALIFGANITSLREHVDKPCVDLDLGVFLDGKGPDNIPDGKAIAEELVTYDADQDAEERIKIINPTVEDDPDTPGINEAVVGAPYIIKVLGFDTGGQCLFNIDINLVQGQGFEVEGISQTMIGPFTVGSIGVSWKLPSDTPDGELMGAFYMGPYEAPMALLVPIELTIERVPPEIFNFGIVTDKQVNHMDNMTTNDPEPTITIYVKDDTRGELDWRSVMLFLDDEDITHLADVDVPFEDPDGRDGPKEYGYWNGAVTYKPPTPLPDRSYKLRLEIKDLAGNQVVEEFIFIIDTLAPTLEDGKLNPINNFSTNVPTAILDGTTEPFARVIVRGTNLTADDKGYFSTVLDLEPGINDILVTAVDWFGIDLSGDFVMGNSFSITRRIILDEVAPTIDHVSNSTGTPTNSDYSIIRGKVQDEILKDVPNPLNIEFKVNGNPINIQADGGFVSIVPLDDGQNTITLVAKDPAGNYAERQFNITKDVTAPVLNLESVPTEVSSETIVIEGTTEAGATVLINGKYVPSPGGSFSEDVHLVEGMNVIVVEVFDSAGNVDRRSLSVMYSPEAPSTLYISVPLYLLAMILIFLIGWKIGSGRMPKREAGVEGAEPEGKTEEETEAKDETQDEASSEDQEESEKQEEESVKEEEKKE